MPATESAGSSKCFSGILRCLLCKGSLPTHPSDDHFTVSNMKDEAKYHLKQAYERSLGAAENVYNVKKPLASSSQSPGLVARLMGLDSLPDTRDRSLGSILRSRSVNSIDFLSHLDFQKQGTCLNQHRRVRTSVSFRDDDYYSIVLQLEEELVEENDLREDEQQIKNKTQLNGHEEKKEKQKKRTRKLNNGACVKQSSGDADGVKSQRADVCGRTSPTRLRERRKTIPVNNPKKEVLTASSKYVKSEKNKIAAHKLHSVRSLKKIHPEEAVQDADLVKKPRSRRSSTSEIAKSKKSSCSRSLQSDNGESIAFIEGQAEKRKMAKNEEKCYYRRIVEVICKLTEESLDKTWMMMHGDGTVLKLEDTEEISRQLEDDILEELLAQFVDEEVVITF